MIDILLKTNYFRLIDESRIDKIKEIISKELKNKEEKNIEIKKLIYISCLKILIIFYFSYDKDIDNKYEEKKIKNNEQKFHLFIRKINLNLEFFHSLISLLRQINFITNNNSNEEEFINKNENINNEINNCKEKNLSSLPFWNMDLQNLNDIQIQIIKSIFEDIVYILYIIELKKIDIEKKENNINNDSFNQNNNINLEKEISEILKKNIDFISKFGKTTKLYQEIFSSDTPICAEFFYLLWRFDINGGEESYFEKVISKYHNNLLKNHSNPFIFKFYLYLSNKNIFPL